MKKIPSVFQRNWDGDGLIRNEPVAGTEWVIAGEGVATRKYDGSCCKVEGGVLYKRYDAKNGKTPPEGFIPAQEPDPVTGHWTGWLKVSDAPGDKYFREAWEGHQSFGPLADGTYELLGPKVQSNPENMPFHILQGHSGATRYEECPRDFEGIREFLRPLDIEGVVFHHSDGRMAKVKKRDYGMKRKPEIVPA